MQKTKEWPWKHPGQWDASLRVGHNHCVYLWSQGQRAQQTPEGKNQTLSSHIRTGDTTYHWKTMTQPHSSPHLQLPFPQSWWKGALGCPPRSGCTDPGSSGWGLSCPSDWHKWLGWGQLPYSYCASSGQENQHCRALCNKHLIFGLSDVLPQAVINDEGAFAWKICSANRCKPVSSDRSSLVEIEHKKNKFVSLHF